ncbi:MULTISPECIES: helix-turn-helix domain-containing protein [Pseudomonas]|jgi:transcriptional regulator with XRE-family HTH domain|uniref:helix-turn-helix domain-containing protein n=1 Tax=Pseudomonas TaxID=286 RepID=UPI0005789992|nr:MULTISPECIES: helix-turn-helix transcriptional regulator [Pseudomonas]MCS3419092.1 transcriptional regulator with XRE-family HTH domain [Pseudomonas sp. BIGb0558]MCS3438584.1 transcriptional regulator with XRE-family HTH domain [Pseudomonas sp. BIGb0450]
MPLKRAFAAVLRVLRSRKGLSQEGLSEAGTRTYLAQLEKGESGITLDKLDLLSKALDTSPLTLLALTLAIRQNEPIESVLGRLTAELSEHLQTGLMEELKAQLQDDALVVRKPGKPVDENRLRQVHQHKAEGLTQKQIAEKLGLSKQTVHDLWHRKSDT